MNAILPAKPAGRHRPGEHAARAHHRVRHHQARRTSTSTTTTRSARGGYHTIKGGYGFQHVVNDINTYYPGGFVEINWGGSVHLRRRQPRHRHLRLITRSTTAAPRTRPVPTSTRSIIQDQWTIGNRLTLNLGLRTEDEKIPSFRPAVPRDGHPLQHGDKLAPRLGAAYDVFGDGRMKVFGSWGMYYDWTKYELPRGSFGAETWCMYYRGLDTTDLGSINLSNMPGRGPLDDARQLPRPSRAVVCRQHRPGHQADASVELQCRHGLPAQPEQRAHRALRPQRPAADDRGPRRARRAAATRST